VSTWNLATDLALMAYVLLITFGCGRQSLNTEGCSQVTLLAPAVNRTSSPSRKAGSIVWQSRAVSLIGRSIEGRD